jgi:hypothetical protein
MPRFLVLVKSAYDREAPDAARSLFTEVSETSPATGGPANAKEPTVTKAANLADSADSKEPAAVATNAVNPGDGKADPADTKGPATTAPQERTNSSASLSTQSSGKDAGTGKETTLQISWHILPTNAIQPCRRTCALDKPGALMDAIGEPGCLSAHEIEATSELDAYHRMVLKDHHFSLEQFLTLWRLWQPNKNGCAPEHAIMRSVFADLDPATQKQLLLEGSEYLFPRTWITPALAKRMWLAYNDPRPLLLEDAQWGSALGFNCAIPAEHLTYARILPIQSIPLTSL